MAAAPPDARGRPATSTSAPGGIDAARALAGRAAWICRPGRADLALGAVKYRFITAIEGCTRGAYHLATAAGWPAAETNADAVRELARRDVLGTRVATAVADAVGFRNLLVHQYAAVDDHRTVAHLQRLDDLEAFGASVARWLASPQGG